MPRAPPGLLSLLLMAGLMAIAAVATDKNNLHQQQSHSHHLQQQQQPQQQHPQKQQPAFEVALADVNQRKYRTPPPGGGNHHQRRQVQHQSGGPVASYAEEQITYLEEVNPWLSACDLHPSNQVDLQVPACDEYSSHHRRGASCPLACPHTTNINISSTNQCLFYLEDTHKEEVCGGQKPDRNQTDKLISKLKQLRMGHCCEHTVYSSMNDTTLAEVLKKGPKCRRFLEDLIQVDRLAARVSCVYAEVLSRYDCAKRYSIVHDCNDCKEAYRRWTCSSLIPLFAEETIPLEAAKVAVTTPNSPVKRRRVRPCLRVCQDVEQQCPYMLPNDRAPNHPTQYAGEPTFLCLDPNIPERGEQRAKSSVGDEDCCYSHCGSPGRGVQRVYNHTICVNCPGRPPSSSTALSSTVSPAHHHLQSQQDNTEDPPELVRCTFVSSPKRECKISGDTSTSAASATNKSQTLLYNKVQLVWTAWIISYNIKLHTLQTTIYNILKCLLVLCANCVRTTLLLPLMRIKTKWREWS